MRQSAARAGGLAPGPRSRSSSGKMKAGITDLWDLVWAGPAVGAPAWPGLPRSRRLRARRGLSTEQGWAGPVYSLGLSGATASLLCPLLIQVVTRVGPGSRREDPCPTP